MKRLIKWIKRLLKINDNTMDAKQGELITAGSTNATELEVTDIEVSSTSRVKFFISIISGTVKFSLTEAGLTSAHGWAAGDVVPPFEVRGSNSIWFDAASSADTFVINATT